MSLVMVYSWLASGHVTAVDRHAGTGDKAGFRPDQISHHGGDLCRAAHAPERDQRLYRLRDAGSHGRVAADGNNATALPHVGSGSLDGNHHSAHIDGQYAVEIFHAEFQ